MGLSHTSEGEEPGGGGGGRGGEGVTTIKFFDIFFYLALSLN